MSQQGLNCAKESIFWGKNGRFWAKYAKKKLCEGAKVLEHTYQKTNVLLVGHGTKWIRKANV